jgi:hypothetical protein
MLMRKNKFNEYKEVIDRLNKYFFSMDDKYYSELEGKPNDMSELIDFLNKIKV